MAQRHAEKKRIIRSAFFVQADGGNVKVEQYAEAGQRKIGTNPQAVVHGRAALHPLAALSLCAAFPALRTLGAHLFPAAVFGAALCPGGALL